MSPAAPDAEPTAPEAEQHPSSSLDDTVHQRARLGILSILSETKRADFSYLKRTLELTDGNLSRHLQVLEEQQLVRVQKGYQARRPHTWVTITHSGRRALTTEMDALRELLHRFDNAHN
jgi:DNA-binding MarR family transcriptional regulator